MSRADPPDIRLEASDGGEYPVSIECRSGDDATEVLAALTQHFGAVATDGGRDPLVDAIQLQTAVQLEIAHALTERNHKEFRELGEHRRATTVSFIEDNALDLIEGVDLDRVRRGAE